MARLLIVFLVMGISACSAPVVLGPEYGLNEQAIVAPDTSRLIIYNTKSLASSMYYKISVDGKAVGVLGLNTFLAHVMTPGTVTVSARKRGAGEGAITTALVILSVGGAARSAKRYKERQTSVPLDVTAEGGTTAYLRLNEVMVEYLFECEESGDEAQLCQGRRTDIIFESVPEAEAEKELVTLRESLK